MSESQPCPIVGLVVLQGGEVIGAIDVGGAKGSEKDEACAKVGLTKLAAEKKS